MQATTTGGTLSGPAPRGPRARAGGWRDALDAQLGLWRWYRSENGARFMAGSLAQNGAGLNPQVQQMQRGLYAAEMGDALSLADPIWCSPEMCELVGHAAELFQPEPLVLTDLLVQEGFLRYATPFVVPDRFDEPTTIAGCSWRPMISTSDEQEVERWRELAAQAMGAEYWEQEAQSTRQLAGIALTLYAESTPDTWPEEFAAGLPPVVPMHLTPWWFGMTFDGNEVDETGKVTGAAWWWKIVQSSFRLMQQHIATRKSERPDRGQRREAKRARFPEDREVVVVRLRREGSAPKDGPSEPANYSHRFIVGGHWRNQWYPSAGLHRQIWISDYIKGPEDQPLVIRPRRVFTWDR